MSKEWYSNWECDDKIICPYCGKKYEPTYEETYIGGKGVDCYKEGEQGRFACDECGNEFTLSAEMKWEYTTETETWNGIHTQITAPKGTFKRIFNDTDESEGSK